MMDLDIHQAVIENNDSYTGCTLYVVEEIVDEGKIVMQRESKLIQ